MSGEQPPRLDEPPASGDQGGDPNTRPGYTADLWGNPVELPRERNNRKGKNGTVYIGGLVLQQERLFSPEEMQIPLPDAPINKTPDFSADTAAPGTLFYTPDPAPPHTQDELFAAPPEPAPDTPTLPPASDTQEADEPLRLPVDPDVGYLPGSQE